MSGRKKRNNCNFDFEEHAEFRDQATDPLLVKVDPKYVKVDPTHVNVDPKP